MKTSDYYRIVKQDGSFYIEEKIKIKTEFYIDIEWKRVNCTSKHKGSRVELINETPKFKHLKDAEYWIFLNSIEIIN